MHIIGLTVMQPLVRRAEEREHNVIERDDRDEDGMITRKAKA